MSVFHMLAVEKDLEGYYIVRWDRAIPVEIEAETRAEAFTKLWAILADAQGCDCPYCKGLPLAHAVADAILGDTA